MEVLKGFEITKVEKKERIMRDVEGDYKESYMEVVLRKEILKPLRPYTDYQEEFYVVKNEGMRKKIISIYNKDEAIQRAIEKEAIKFRKHALEEYERKKQDYMGWIERGSKNQLYFGSYYLMGKEDIFDISQKGEITGLKDESEVLETIKGIAEEKVEGLKEKIELQYKFAAEWWVKQLEYLDLVNMSLGEVKIVYEG